MKKICSFLMLISLSAWLRAQSSVDVYPTHWWVGMKWNKVQLLMHSPTGDFSNQQFSIKYPGIRLAKVHQLENKHYTALDLGIAPTAKVGEVLIQLTENGKTQTLRWPLKARRTGKGATYAQGVTSADLMYLLMPDRFSNGDPSNDRIPGMRDQTLNRDTIYDRHGGDIQGVINHLGYLHDLGVTSLWMTPVIENDMPNRTEHGYAFTNHYKIDPRHGGNEAYRKLSDALHARGMKLVQDAVYNHVGFKHFTVLDPPMKDWLNQWPEYTNTNYKEQPLFDLYGTARDRKRMSDGWFTPQMPDVNQKNPFAANFLIQHALWSVEEFGVDGWRIDTYIYNDLLFMNRCNQALLDEYPKLSLFGETWVHGVLNQAFFVENNLQIPFKSNLSGATDFQTNLYGITKALNEPFGWTDGVNKLYVTLTQDLVYKDPMKQVIFLDNHDMSRFFTQVNEDVAKHKMGLAWLLTCLGIPQLYYGIEVLMKGSTSPNDGWVRMDFPGGWPNDKKNAFTGAGLTGVEAEVQKYVRTLANFRKQSSAIKTGKMTQYVPIDGLYIYFRHDANQTVMCIMNTSDKDRTVNFGDYEERTKGFSKAFEVTANTQYATQDKLTVDKKTLLVLELKK